MPGKSYLLSRILTGDLTDRLGCGVVHIGERLDESFRMAKDARIRGGGPTDVGYHDDISALRTGILDDEIVRLPLMPLEDFFVP